MVSWIMKQFYKPYKGQVSSLSLPLQQQQQIRSQRDGFFSVFWNAAADADKASEIGK